jgi:hypothetical protein
VREDGIRMALSRHPVIRFPSSEDGRYIKRFVAANPAIKARGGANFFRRPNAFDLPSG